MTIAADAVEVDQRWIARGSEGQIIRRLRILAPHPDGGWIFEESAVDGRLLGRRISVIPDFNLRYVFRLEEL